MRKILTAVLFALIATASTVAAAQVQAERKWNKADDCALQRAQNPKATCVLEFETTGVEGKVLGPNWENLPGRAPVKHATLIRYRTEFVSQIIQSAEQR